MRYQINLEIYFNFNNKILAEMAIPLYNSNDQESDQREGEQVAKSESEPSFLGRFVQELVESYYGEVTCNCSGCSNGESGSSGGSRRTSANRERRMRRGKLPSTSDPPPLPLPDLVADHEQSIRRPRPGLSSHQPDQGNNELCNAIQVPRQQFRADSSDADSDPSGLSLDLKLSIDYNYRKIGQGLRQIADQFQHDRSQNQSRRRRRHPAGNQYQTTTSSPDDEISITFEFALKITIPLTLLGLSLAFIRRNCA
ncbi:uncharacterized protein LOC110847785 isoform X2 [Folsomia candida]|uniref:uncharacterized protein LOC110847785 isoform X2 n=1 Tax=Folsomia candida TaxID=158441 RepID=UPI001604C5A6|nr:uncharacterized protein LOC110847785 isoform X2 [Folsomia candida]